MARYLRPPNDTYNREPFATDVSEGKNDPIYNAHSYHTKVPHKAIMRYILHYTEPGDVVFDGFCGTGMTGVATQLCGDKATVESLGYRVKSDGMIILTGRLSPASITVLRCWVIFPRLRHSSPTITPHLSIQRTSARRLGEYLRMLKIAMGGCISLWTVLDLLR